MHHVQPARVQAHADTNGLRPSGDQVTGSTKAEHSAWLASKSCPPHGENDAASSVAAPVASGHGVGTRPCSLNLDACGICVRKGHTVHLGISVGLVLVVHKGFAVVRWIVGVQTTVPCYRLEVVRSLGRLNLDSGAMPGAKRTRSAGVRSLNLPDGNHGDNSFSRIAP